MHPSPAPDPDRIAARLRTALEPAAPGQTAGHDGTRPSRARRSALLAVLRLLSAAGPAPVAGPQPGGSATLRLLAAELRALRRSPPGHDVLGPVLERLLPADERQRFGQHFTHPDVVDLLVAACVRSPRDRVLDAGCGTGAFLLRALERKRALEGRRALDPRPDGRAAAAAGPAAADSPADPLAADLCGVDRSPLSARLAAANLALHGAPGFRALRRDFFSLDPRELGPFDAVVGNPPYTRHERLGRAGAAPAGEKREIVERALDGYPGLRFSRRSPLHVYFLLHAAKFLREGGRLGMVLPAGWLASDYGADLQSWLLRHFSRVTVVEAEAEPWFRIPSVATCLLLAERRPGGDPVRFARLRAPLAEVLPDAGEGRWRAAEGFWERIGAGGDQRLRVAAVPRSAAGGNWSIHLRAPDVYLDLRLRGGRRLVPLRELAEVRFAVKTGANDFFLLRPDRARELGIEPRYLRPLLRSLRDAPAIRVLAAPHLLFSCEDPPPAGSAAAAYVLRGEALGYHRRPTCAARRPWHALGRREPWPLLYPERCGERFLVLLNEAGAAVNKNLYELRPRDARLTLPLCAVLNSTWTRLGNELHGRVLVGNQDVVDSDARAVEQILVPDLRRAEARQLERLDRALRALWERPVLPIDREVSAEGRAELDAAALEAFADGPPPVAELQEAALQVVRARLRRGEGVGSSEYRPTPRERFARGDRP